MGSLDDVTLAILAGGQGRRLGGVAKGLLRIDGEPVIARLLRLGVAFAETILIADDPRPYAAFGVRAFSDVHPGHGAPGGLHSALHHARTPWIAAVGVDMPFIRPELFEPLIARCRSGALLACFEVGEHLQPLLAIYARSLSAELEAALARGGGLRSLFDHPRAAILPPDALRAADPELKSVVSLNRPEDLHLHQAELPAEEGE